MLGRGWTYGFIVGNNPINAIDPNGQIAIFWAAEGAWGVGVTIGGAIVATGIAYKAGEAIGTLLGQFDIWLNTKNDAGEKGGSCPPSLSPAGAGRRGARREALRRNGVPTSQPPSRELPNTDRGGKPQPGRVYEYDVPAAGGGKRTIGFRDDAGGHDYGPGNPQNRGPHFNDGAGNHYDY